MIIRRITPIIWFFFSIPIFGQMDSLPQVYYGELPYSELEGSSSLEIIEDDDKELLPRVDLSKYFPPAGDQGESNSCWAYATTYAYLSFLKIGSETNGYYTSEGYPNYNKIFSPAFTYNLYKDEASTCLGLNRSIEVLGKLIKDGGVSFSEFPFPEDNCVKIITSNTKEKAKRNAIKGYYVQRTEDLHTIKSLLNNGTPMIMAMTLDDNFKRIGFSWKSENLPIPIWKTYGNRKRAHAMVITGYDEDLGAVKVLNSWGHKFGDNGYIWISYDLIESKHFGYAAYLQKSKLPFRDNFEGIADQPDKSIPIAQQKDRPHSTWVKKKYYRKFDGLRFALTAFKPRKGFGLIRVLNNENEELERFYIEKGQSINFYIENQKYGFRFDNAATVDGTNPLTKAMYFTINKY